MMNAPHNIFVFEVESTLYIFLAYGDFSMLEFTDFIDSASSTYIPNKVALFYHQDILSNSNISSITDHLKSRFRCEPHLFKFDREGKFTKKDPLIDSFIANGKTEIITLRKPVMYPPPGKAFMKPSGTKESFFIQASNLFLRHAEMSFIALLLIREWGRKFEPEVKVIYVDTIDLYGLTSLASRMRLGPEKLGPITVSYSSYDRFKEVLKHADVSNSLMVISATTSHNLLRDITVMTRWKETDRVVTILSLDPTAQHGGTAIANPKVIAYVKPEDAELHINHLPAIRLAGEKFTIEVDEPKSVVFKAKSHGSCLSRLKLPKLIEMKNVFSAFVMVEGVMLPITVGLKELMEHRIFLDWLKEQIEKYAPASTSHIVLMDVDFSQIKPLLAVFGTNTPVCVTPKQLQDSSLKINGSVLVICPTFSTGSKLLEISRDLRKQPNLKNVTYFTGIGTPESKGDYDKLCKNLQVDGFRVVSFCNVATGLTKSLVLSWQHERELIRREDALKNIVELQERAALLDAGKLNDATLFYRVDDLELHAGFKFWDWKENGYDHTQKHSLLMFITFAFLFQDARTNVNLNDEDRFAQLLNRRVLLDPENLFRYNDRLIQVSILRSTFPVEMDYSDHEVHSKSIVYLFQREEHVGNRAMVYEILLALATKRLKVTPEKLDEIKKIVSGSTIDECKWFASIPFFTLNKP